MAIVDFSMAAKAHINAGNIVQTLLLTSLSKILVGATGTDRATKVSCADMLHAFVLALRSFTILNISCLLANLINYAPRCRVL